jgi:hypothetical protein
MTNHYASWLTVLRGVWLWPLVRQSHIYCISFKQQKVLSVGIMIKHFQSINIALVKLRNFALA